MERKDDNERSSMLNLSRVKTLDTLLEKEGRLEMSQVLKMSRPFVEMMAEEHREGRCLGDITPENIVIYGDMWFYFPRQEKETEAADAAAGGGKVDQENRYIAAEEYVSQDNKGPRSDVYSVCAVIYRAITGVAPQNAQKRMQKDELKLPSELGVHLSAAQEEALWKGLSILAKDRYQNGEELYRTLYQAEDGKEGLSDNGRDENQNEKPRQDGNDRETGDGIAHLSPKDNKKRWMIGIGAAAILLVCVIFFFTGRGVGNPSGTVGTGDSQAAGGTEASSDVEISSDTAETEAVSLTAANVLREDEVPEGQEEKTYFLQTDILCEDILSITFFDSLDGAPEDAWDVSAAQSGSVMAWAEAAGTRYDVYIAGEGGVAGHPNSADLFMNCVNMTSLNFNGCFDTSRITDMGRMFCNCSSLTELDVSGFDTSQVESMMSMFYGCSDLTELDVSGFDTSRVTNMYSMFYNCSSLTELDVSGFDTSQVTNIQRMFGGCAGVTELDVSGFDTSQVTTMRSMFNGCAGVTELDVSGFNTSQVTDMSYMFYGCTGVTGLDVSGFDTSQVITMYAMFYNCAGVTELDVSGFNTSQVTDMSHMFNECASVTELDVSGFDTSQVTTMRTMFQNCANVTELNVSGFNTSQVTDMSYMFYGCAGVTGLNVSGFDTSQVTDMSYMFYQCGSLTELDISGFDMTNVTNTDGMLAGTQWEE